ncbi:uncharacterized protein [Physcomitrium patens]|uniref:uncharacterized protein n=1 Tax=Physcomitrium patens TaxID=3218 RepID=UPI003CCE0BC1
MARGVNCELVTGYTSLIRIGELFSGSTGGLESDAGGALVASLGGMVAPFSLGLFTGTGRGGARRSGRGWQSREEDVVIAWRCGSDENTLGKVDLSGVCFGDWNRNEVDLV